MWLFRARGTVLGDLRLIGLVGILLSTALAASAQVCGPINYQAEPEAIANSQGKATRDGRKLILRAGTPVVFTDTSDEDDPPQPDERYFLFEVWQSPPAFVVLVQHLEWQTFLLIDATDGSSIELSGVPQLSPARDRFAIVNFAGFTGYHPDTVQIWQRSGTMWIREFEFDSVRAISLCFHRWEAADSIELRADRWEERWIKTNDGTMTFEESVRLHRTGDTWVLTPPIPAEK